jgi:predicted ribosome quality control (RQC) complex YloA/Tae2 family protein
MNQDQVKEQLLKLEDDVEEFFLIFSGKRSKKVNGLYHPETREIIIHNRNFDDDMALMYTAIHEFAHHIHFTTSPTPVGSRAHTVAFRSILHRLLSRAESLEVYANPFEADPEFESLTRRIKTQFLKLNGRLMKDFGEALIEAETLCRRRGARFDEYVERVLAMDKRTASTLMKIHTYDINPELGYTNMATVAGIKSEDARLEAQERFAAGQSPDMVKMELRSAQKEPEDPVKQLEKERARIQRTIEKLNSRLEEVEMKLRKMDSAG